MNERLNNHCMVCGSALAYLVQPLQARCHYCGETVRVLISCPAGHTVCDSCHGADALTILEHRADQIEKSAPEDILEELLRLPQLPMHGPEHHAMAGLALVLAARRAGHRVPEGATVEMIRRGTQIPGGACGYLGACGAGVSVGMAASLLVGATPLTGEKRALANRASAAALFAVADDAPRCCKRGVRTAVGVGRRFVAEALELTLPPPQAAVRCSDMKRNTECALKSCPYFREGKGEKQSVHERSVAG